MVRAWSRRWLAVTLAAAAALGAAPGQAAPARTAEAGAPAGQPFPAARLRSASPAGLLLATGLVELEGRSLREPELEEPAGPPELSGPDWATQVVKGLPDDVVVGSPPLDRAPATRTVPAASSEADKIRAVETAKKEAEAAKERAAAQARAVSSVVETLDVNRVKRECPRMPCPAGLCSFKDGICCASGKHCCPADSTCLDTDPPSCIRDPPGEPLACAEGPCKSENACPHKGVYLCCADGQSCCSTDYRCERDGQCSLLATPRLLQRRFEDNRQAQAAVDPRTPAERRRVMRLPESQREPAEAGTAPTDPVIRIVTRENRLVGLDKSAGGTMEPVAKPAAAGGAASAQSGSASSSSASETADMVRARAALAVAKEVVGDAQHEKLVAQATARILDANEAKLQKAAAEAERAAAIAAASKTPTAQAAAAKAKADAALDAKLAAEVGAKAPGAKAPGPSKS